MADDGFISDLMDFTFTRFITVKWIKLLYMVGIALIGIQLVVEFIVGVITLFSADGAGKLMGLVIWIAAVVASALEIIALRIYLELIVVLFRIEEHTRMMAPNSMHTPGGPGFPVTPVTPVP
jgi:hypothetical protein